MERRVSCSAGRPSMRPGMEEEGSARGSRVSNARRKRADECPGFSDTQGKGVQLVCHWEFWSLAGKSPVNHTVCGCVGCGAEGRRGRALFGDHLRQGVRPGGGFQKVIATIKATRLL